VKVLGGDLAQAALALAELQPPAGRGRRYRVNAEFGAFEVIDESYNASPMAMRAAFEVLAASPVRGRGRRIAVLGDMLELGAEAEALHRGLAAELERHGIDLVMGCGPHTAALLDALPVGMRGPHAEDSDALLPQVLAAVHAGDVVLVKGSLGSRMAPIVSALLILGGESVAAKG
jgi:UDP-N-acetylmuramoyl-tripeptide--D-alanyl-D-alanine ligase